METGLSGAPSRQLAPPNDCPRHELEKTSEEAGVIAKAELAGRPRNLTANLKAATARVAPTDFKLVPRRCRRCRGPAILPRGVHRDETDRIAKDCGPLTAKRHRRLGSMLAETMVPIRIHSGSRHPSPQSAFHRLSGTGHCNDFRRQNGCNSSGHHANSGDICGQTVPHEHL